MISEAEEDGAPSVAPPTRQRRQSTRATPGEGHDMACYCYSFEGVDGGAASMFSVTLMFKDHRKHCLYDWLTCLPAHSSACPAAAAAEEAVAE